MKYLDEYRDPVAARRCLDAIAISITRPWTIMEVCGGQTHAIIKYGIDRLLPPELQLVHGPGCPVCVTALETIDQALALASLPHTIFCSFGDMLRVPGSRGDLLQLKSRGCDVRIVYSPLDAVRIARTHRDHTVVFFAVGFETTAPANAMAIWWANQLGLKNFRVLVSQVLVPPAMEAILLSPENQVQGFLGPGHVCTVMGCEDYTRLALHHRVPIVVTGFEPLDILDGVLRVVRQLESRRAELEIQYSRAVRPEGNPRARQVVDEIFEVCDQRWRGIGLLPNSGLKLRARYREHDAEPLLASTLPRIEDSSICMSGDILRGVKKPHHCPAFGKQCTPSTPLGATMVSSEGACAAYYLHGRHLASLVGSSLEIPQTTLE